MHKSIKQQLEAARQQAGGAEKLSKSSFVEWRMNFPGFRMADVSDTTAKKSSNRPLVSDYDHGRSFT